MNTDFDKNSEVTGAVSPVTENRDQEHRGGVTLIEALFVLGIMAVLIGMVMVFLSQTTMSTKTNQLSEEISSLVDTAHELYQGQPDYSGISASVLAQSGLFPNRWVNSSNVISPFGATMTISSTSDQGISAFQISIPTVPKPACVKIATTDYGNALLSRSPAGGSGENSGSITAAQPLTPDQATTECSSSGTTMTFDFS